MGENLIDDDPSEWLKENVERFIEQAKTNGNDVDLLHLILDAVERLSHNENQVNI